MIREMSTQPGQKNLPSRVLPRPLWFPARRWSDVTTNAMVALFLISNDNSIPMSAEMTRYYTAAHIALLCSFANGTLDLFCCR